MSGTFQRSFRTGHGTTQVNCYGKPEEKTEESVASKLYDVVVNQFSKSGDSGYYADTGGYGWYFNAGTLELDMVYAPGGGQRIAFAHTDPKWAAIFNTVVSGKTPKATKGEVAYIAGKAGGLETVNKAIAASSSQGKAIAASVPVTVKTKTPGSPTGPDAPFYEADWFLPALGGVVVLGALAIAFWPAKHGPVGVPT